MPSPPRPLILAGRKGPLGLAALSSGLSGAAMLPAMATMSARGASMYSFETAGTTARSEAILASWGAPGRRAMRRQLLLDLPFLAGYAVLLAGAGARVAERAGRQDRPRLGRVAAAAIWLGPLAACTDMVQNAASAAVLAGHTEQPWPRVAALATEATKALLVGALVSVVGGALASAIPTSPGNRRRSLRP